MDIAVLIRNRLEELGLGQRDLARAAHVTESDISQLLTQKKLPPAPNRTDMYEKIGRVLKLPHGQLAKLADQQRREHLRKRLGNPPPALLHNVRELILRKARGLERGLHQQERVALRPMALVHHHPAELVSRRGAKERHAGLCEGRAPMAVGGRLERRDADQLPALSQENEAARRCDALAPVARSNAECSAKQLGERRALLWRALRRPAPSDRHFCPFSWVSSVCAPCASEPRPYSHRATGALRCEEKGEYHTSTASAVAKASRRSSCRNSRPCLVLPDESTND